MGGNSSAIRIISGSKAQGNNELAFAEVQKTAFVILLQRRMFCFTLFQKYFCAVRLKALSS